MLRVWIGIENGLNSIPDLFKYVLDGLLTSMSMVIIFHIPSSS